jgi:hypothetical protein
MCLNPSPFLQILEPAIQTVLNLEQSAHLHLNSLDATLSHHLSTSNNTLLKLLYRWQNPHGVYTSRLKRHNRKNSFGYDRCDSWRYEDCHRRHEEKKKRNAYGDEEVRRFERRRKEDVDRCVESWMEGMRGMSWDRRARCCEKGIY